MKNFRNNILFIFLSVLFFSSCKKENRCDCIKRTGEVVTEVRSVPTFNKLFVEQNVNVFITEGPVAEVKVEAGENIVPLIQTIVEDGILIIRNKNRCNWARSYKKTLNVYVTTPGLDAIKLNGTGDIKSLNTITKDTMDLTIENSGNIELTVNNSKVVSHIYGYGDLTLNGFSGSHLCSIGGTAFLYCKGLVTGYTFIRSYTLGTCYLDVAGTLECTMDDKGDIYCYGNPSVVHQTKNGSGVLHIE